MPKRKTTEEPEREEIFETPKSSQEEIARFNEEQKRILEGAKKQSEQLDRERRNREVEEERLRLKKQTEETGIGAPEVFRDDTGKIVGIVGKSGKALFGFDDQDARDYLARQQRIGATPEGAIEATTGGRELVGQVGELTAEQQALIQSAKGTDFTNEQARKAAIAGSIKGGVGRAVQGGIGGAGVGFVGGGGIGGAIILGVSGAVGGGTVGLIEGFYRSYIADVEQQAKGEVTASTVVLAKGEANLRLITSTAWSGRGDKITLLKSFNNQLTRIEAEHSKLQQEITTNKKFALDDGTVALQKYEDFYSAGGSRDFLIDSFRQALISTPDQDKALALLGGEDLRQYEESL